MERSFFRQVKEAMAANAQATLTEIGVNLKHGVKGEWSQCLCPLCGDTSGSASITQEGFLRCHQCGAKLDLCEWYAKKMGITPWEACKALGEILRLDMAIKKHRGRPPKVMSHEILRGAVSALWEGEQSENCRTFFKNRKLDDPQMLERFGVGFIGGYIVFCQWTPTGHLRACYRCYTPGGKPPWLWKGGTRGGTLGFWPHFQLPDDGVIWLLEGEFDVLTAWTRMRLQDQGIYCATWTGGAGSPIKPYAIPEAWRGREIHIVPDNDVFQGPVLEEHRAPDDKKMKELRLRWKILMNEIAPSFLAQNCKVFLRSIPIDPLETWGGDFRDWVDGGGRNLDDLKPHLFKDLRPKVEAPTETDFLGVYELAGKDTKFNAQVASIDAEGLTVPTCISLVCDMGSMPYCANCKAPVRFAEGVIHCKDYRDDIAQALMARDPTNYIMRHVVGKPPACVHAKLDVVEYEVSSRWTAMHDDVDEASERSLTIISKDTPPLSGEIEIVGRVHHANQRVMVMADQIRQLDRAEVDIGPHLNDLVQMCPFQSDKPEEIQEYLDKRCADLACSVTKIYGRPALHLAHDLLAHSALWLTIDGIRLRGWLDIAVAGDTRTGKSMTFQRLMEHHRLGMWQNCGENISRPGLTMGGDRQDGTYKLKPGLFPRSHKKMLILDEFHDVVKEGVIKCLQGARDDGRVFATKIYGSRMMPAAVRFGTIANWPYDREKFRFMCEHFQSIYGTPECLSRTDFCLVVADEPTESGLVDVDHFWTDAHVRALILRAWAMDETMVHIDPKAVEYAKQKCKEWTGYYSPVIPMFTPEEKHLSLLRIAAAVSNMTFCHPDGEAYHARVNIGHVVWAAEFLAKTWAWSEYESYSIVTERKKTLDRPFPAEAEISVGLDLANPDDASALLPDFLGGFSATQAGSMLGKEHYDTMKWVNKMIRLGVLMQSRDSRNGYFTEIRPTKAGDIFLRNLILLAEEFPGEWKLRHDKMATYVVSRVDPKLTPLTESREKLRREWQDRDG